MNNTTNDTTNAKEETTAEKLARLQQNRAKREKGRDEKRLEREVRKLELAEEFEAKLGAEGSEFFIYDSGHLDDPLFVVKRGLLIQYTKYEDSKQTHADRFDFVSPSVVHPTLDEYKVARENRIGIEVELANRLAKLYGLNVKVDSGK